jgi:antitoxin ParD1/3/4
MHIFMINHDSCCSVKSMKLITLYLPEPYLEALDELVTKRYYPHRAEAIRVAIRDLISTELWGREKDAKDS